MPIVAVVLVLGGLLQLLAAGLAVKHPKGQPLRTLQGRQLEAALGRTGAVVFFLIAGVALCGLGAWMLIRSG